MESRCLPQAVLLLQGAIYVRMHLRCLYGFRQVASLSCIYWIYDIQKNVLSVFAQNWVFMPLLDLYDIGIRL